jgi:leukotriene A-4 hydrolase/aminopeptidase
MQTDVHSFSNPDEVTVTHSQLDLQLDFDNKLIIGKVTHHIDNIESVNKLRLDIRDIKIKQVVLNYELTAAFNLGDEKPWMGQCLEINIEPDTRFVTIYYETSPHAAALQWLSPKQTSGGVSPFMFTQSEAILARSWIPCQDSPSVRFTYSASVRVPANLMAVMSASNPKEKASDGIYHFEMKQPVPSYLLALAAGDLVYTSLSDRAGVYAEPEVIEKAAWEFIDMEKMVSVAEELYGPYRWEQFDVLVLPPSFPFGGMENPRLVFATPTILSGDRSLVSLIAHELAHSWSGNLVTNATWNDFWLNEGFTVYFERRIMEKIEGSSYSDMLIQTGYQELQNTLIELGYQNMDTCLKLKLKDRDPDDGMTMIAYEKGFFLLLTIEKAIGRDRMDAFLKDYFKTFAFQSMDTEMFIDYLRSKVFKDDKKLENAITPEQWIYLPGLPANCPQIHSKRFGKVEEAIKIFNHTMNPVYIDTTSWTTHEWLYFLHLLPSGMDASAMNRLDLAYEFTQSGNAEILCAWLQLAIMNNYEPAYEKLELFLQSVGRRKFLMPLYKALLKTETGKSLASSIYKKARPNYHYIATASIDALFV